MIVQNVVIKSEIINILNGDNVEKGIVEFHEAFSNPDEDDTFRSEMSQYIDCCNTRGYIQWESIAHYYPEMERIPEMSGIWMQGKNGVPWGYGIGGWEQVYNIPYRHIEFGWKRKVRFEWNCFSGRRTHRYQFLGVTTKEETVRK